MIEGPAKTLPRVDHRPGDLRVMQEVLCDVHGPARPLVAFEKTPVRMVPHGDGINWKSTELHP